MKAKHIYHNPRRQKAFIGAAIGAVANVVGGIISNKKKKKAEQLAFEQQQAQQYRQDNMSQINALAQMANNTAYVDDYKKRISFKYGGKSNRRKTNLGAEIVNSFKTIGDDFKGDQLNNTISQIGQGISNAISPKPLTTPTLLVRKNTFKCGGRKKAVFGIGQAAQGIGNLVGAIAQKVEAPKIIDSGISIQAPQEQKVLTNNVYQVDANGNPIVNSNLDRLQMYKVGGRKRSKRK